MPYTSNEFLPTLHGQLLCTHKYTVRISLVLNNVKHEHKHVIQYEREFIDYFGLRCASTKYRRERCGLCKHSPMLEIKYDNWIDSSIGF